MKGANGKYSFDPNVVCYLLVSSARLLGCGRWLSRNRLLLNMKKALQQNSNSNNDDDDNNDDHDDDNDDDHDDEYDDGDEDVDDGGDDDAEHNDYILPNV